MTIQIDVEILCPKCGEMENILTTGIDPGFNPVPVPRRQKQSLCKNCYQYFVVSIQTEAEYTDGGQVVLTTKVENRLGHS